MREKPLIFMAALRLAGRHPQRAYLHAASVTTYATHDPGGVMIQSNGRWWKPVGRHYPVQHY